MLSIASGQPRPLLHPPRWHRVFRPLIRTSGCGVEPANTGDGGATSAQPPWLPPGFAWGVSTPRPPAYFGRRIREPPRWRTAPDQPEMRNSRTPRTPRRMVIAGPPRGVDRKRSSPRSGRHPKLASRQSDPSNRPFSTSDHVGSPAEKIVRTHGCSAVGILPAEMPAGTSSISAHAEVCHVLLPSRSRDQRPYCPSLTFSNHSTALPSSCS